MTLALAGALRTDQGVDVLVTFSDSRLTIARTDSIRENWTDATIKSIGLGPKSAIVMAGTTTIPVVTAAEGARGLISNANMNRIDQSRQPLSLLEETRQFLTFHQHCFRKIPAHHQHTAEVIVAGFFSDGVPGLVRICNLGVDARLEVFRPRKGDFCAVTIGDSRFTGIATQAFGEAVVSGGLIQNLISRVASVFWDIMQHDGIQGIGGGLCFGMCHRDHACWYWPMIAIDDLSFYRGLPVSDIPDEWRPSAIFLDFDPTIFSTLEAREQTDTFPHQFPQPDLTTTAIEVIDSSDAELVKLESCILKNQD